jgi:sirohydrochlorin ferrochelatase
VLQIVDALRTLAPSTDVRPAFIELASPLLGDALAVIPADRRAVLVPLLLTSGYHDRVDLPAAAARRPGTVRAAVLGPDRRLAVALADRLREAGWHPGDAVVLAAAGSSDPSAVASVHTQADLLRAELAVPVAAVPAAETPTPGFPAEPGRADASSVAVTEANPPRTEVGLADVRVGFGSAADPDVAAAVAAARAEGARRVVIAPYLVAPGHFMDRLGEAGADVVAAPLGAHPAVLEVILDRAREASSQG